MKPLFSSSLILILLSACGCYHQTRLATTPAHQLQPIDLLDDADILKYRIDNQKYFSTQFGDLLIKLSQREIGAGCDVSVEKQGSIIFSDNTGDFCTLYSIPSGLNTNIMVLESASAGSGGFVKYGIFDTHRQIYKDEDDYSVGHLKLADLDNDGISEIIRIDHAFSMLPEDAHNVEAIYPKLIYKYTGSKYQIANRDFSSYILQDINDKIRKASEANTKLATQPESIQTLDHSQLLSLKHNSPTLSRFYIEYQLAILDVVLSYIYAGQTEVAWSYFRENYKLGDAISFETEIKGCLFDSIAKNYI